jgi:hypothetical protein
MGRGLFLMLAVVARVSMLGAQPEINGQFVTLTNDGTEYTVKVQVSLTSGSAALGYATIQFTFNNGGLSYPASPVAGTDYEFHNFNSPSYILPTVIRTDATTLSINIEFNSGTPTSVDTNPLDVVTIKFSTVNPTGSSNLEWSLMEIYGTDFNPWNIGSWPPHNDTPLPVQLATFVVSIVGQTSLTVEWATLSEVNNYGFYMQRRSAMETAFAELPGSFVAGHGTTNEPQHYSFTDRPTAAGVYYYRLRQVDLNGSEHFSEAIQAGITTSVAELAPKEFRLMQNYPNPFNPETVVKFSVENTARTTLRVYNMIGQEVATLFDDIAEAGRYYQVKVGSSQLASGAYFYRLQSGDKSDLRKMILLK